ncbi:MAG: VOC family protein [Dehalococcoidia bacterium]|nr:VOC family protein [Dehalococcoidia bacterium]MCB9486476.1 VOC family protein [Thermoflexaceae bacterium]
MLKRLDNIGIAVTDARRALEFYTSKLGFQGEVTDGEGAVSLGDISLYIFESKSPAPATARTDSYYENPVGLDHLAFEVDDIDAAAAELETRGIAFLGPAVGAPGEFRFRGFHDPDGNMLYIIQKP